MFVRIRYLAVVFFLFVFIINVSAQTKYYIGLAACGGSPSGHAFVLWGQKKHIDSSFAFQALGFYPSHHTWPNHFKSLIYKVPSEILNEIGTGSLPDTKNFILIEVDTTVYKKTLEVLNEWQNRRFKLFTSDCVTFLENTGFIAGLKMPRRSLNTLTPKLYMKRTVKFNKNISSKVVACNNCCIMLKGNNK